MSNYCVIVADGARARLFSLRDAAVGAGGPNLIEIAALANTEAEMAGKELWRDNSSGRNASPAGGGAHGYDDHRQHHREEVEHRFAKQVAQEVTAALGREKSESLVVVADARMLGCLREAMTLPGSVHVSEVVHDLSKLSPQEIHGHLAADGVLPPRQVPR